MQLGTATAAPGECARGWLHVAELPTAITERLPVIIAEGERDGPTVWLTATIHGDEANALAVAHDVMAAIDPATVTGTIVCLPNVNPAGLRRNDRRPYYGPDLNRRFPTPETIDESPENLSEQIATELFDRLSAAADAVLDLHTAELTSNPFVIRHRVLHGDHRTQREARSLSDAIGALAEAFEFPVINQYDEYVDKRLHRSLTGSMVNQAGIPAVTVELGQHSVITDETVAAGVAGCFRALVQQDVLAAIPDSVQESDPGVTIPVSFPVKRATGPQATTGGILRHHCEPGEPFQDGDPIADIVTSHGTHRETVRAPADGFLVNRVVGAAAYPQDDVASLALRDDGDLVLPREETD